jgi:hypothetical protein
LAHRGSHLGPFRPRPCEKLPFFSHQRKTAPASFDRIITGHKNPTLANCAAQTCAGSLSALRFPNIAFPAYVTLSVGVATPPSRNVTTVGKNAVVSALSPCQLISSSYRTRLLFLLSHCASCVEDAWLESPLPLVADHALISRPALPRRHLGRVHAAQTMRFCLQPTG